MRSLEQEMFNAKGTMTQMREEGCTNAEIAERLGTSTVTVLRYIGKQPTSLRKKPAPRTASTHKVEEAPAPCLAISDREIHLKGQFAKYTVQGSSGTVIATLHETETISISADELGTLINELSAIQRNIESTAVGLEMW